MVQYNKTDMNEEHLAEENVGLITNVLFQSVYVCMGLC